MSSYPLSFTSNNIQHDVTLERTDTPAGRAVTINGKTYQILGSDEAVQMLHSRLQEMPSADFATFNDLEVSLKKSGPTQKTAALFQHAVGKPAANPVAVALADRIQKSKGSQDEIKSMLFEDVSHREDLHLLMDVVMLLVERKQPIKAGYALFPIQQLMTDAQRTPAFLEFGKALLQNAKKAQDLLCLDLAAFHLQMVVDSPDEAESAEAKQLMKDIVSYAKELHSSGNEQTKAACQDILDWIEVNHLLAHTRNLPCTSKEELKRLKDQDENIANAFKTAEAYQERVDARSIAPPGKLCEVPGINGAMHVKMTGTRKGKEPVVILEAGLGSISNDWAYVQDLLGKGGPLTLSYDRAGLGWSGQGKDTASATQSIAHLEGLLKALELHEGPFILVGHSYGGILAQMFALKNADRIEGMILVDSANDASSEIPTNRYTLREWLPSTIEDGKFHQAYDQQTALHANKVMCTTKNFEATNQEKNQFGSSIKLLRDQLPKDKKPFKMPLKVIGAGIYADDMKPFAAAQEGLTERSSSKDSEFILAEKSHHSVMFCQPELIAEQILKFFPDRDESSHIH